MMQSHQPIDLTQIPALIKGAPPHPAKVFNLTSVWTVVQLTMIAHVLRSVQLTTAS